MFKKHLYSAILIIAIFACPAHAIQSDVARSFSTKMPFTPGGVIVKFKGAQPGFGTGTMSISSASSGMRIKKLLNSSGKPPSRSSMSSVSGVQNDTVDEGGLYKIEYPGRNDVYDIVNELKSNPNVEYAEPNYLYQTSVVPNNPDYSSQWALSSIGAPSAWDVTEGDPNIVIAIIDTGVDYYHQDLCENIWTNTREAAGNGIDDDNNGYIDDVHGWNFVSVPPEWLATGENGGPSNNPMDHLGHGTHVAGIAAGKGNNGIGIAGVTWNCKIMPLKAGYEYVDGNGYLESADIISALYYAADNGANIINMSFGSYYDSSFMQDAIDYAHDKGCVLVAAAGNVDSYDAGRAFYPAADNHVIAVSAVDQDDKISVWNFTTFSNFGSFVDLCAPGSSILSTLPGNSYGYESGTSMAAPFVSGVAALVKSKYPYMDPDQIEARLKSTAKNIYSINNQAFLAGMLGAGRVDAKKALGNVSMAITYPKPSSVLSGSTVIRGSADMEYFQSYKIECSDPASPEVWSEVVESSTPVDDGLLCIWSISNPDKKYNLRLTVTNSSGESYSSTSYVNFGDNGDVTLSGHPQCGPSPFDPSKQTFLFYYDLNNAADVDIYVYDITGTLVWQKGLSYDGGSAGNGGSAGPNRVSWDGVNNFGESLGSGAYIYMIIANSSGERKIIGRGKFAVLRT